VSFDEERRSGIGGSDIAAVCGLSPWAGPFDVYAEKTGLVAGKVQTDAMEWGVRLESVVAEAYAEKTGATIRRVNQLLRHKKHPWAIAHLDRRIVKPEKGILEVKTASAWASDEWGEQGTDEVPMHYRCQGLWYCEVAQLPFVDFAVLIAGRHFRMYRVEADPEAQAIMLEQAEELWDRIQRQDPPPIDGSDGATRYLAARFPKVELEEVEPDENDERLADSYLALRTQKDAIEKHMEELANLLREKLGVAGAMSTSHARVTWREVTTKRTDWKAVTGELAPPDDIIEKHTTSATTRRFEVRERKAVG
jgi:putative phage-type endonuclease